MATRKEQMTEARQKIQTQMAAALRDACGAGVEVTLRGGDERAVALTLSGPKAEVERAVAYAVAAPLGWTLESSAEDEEEGDLYAYMRAA